MAGSAPPWASVSSSVRCEESSRIISGSCQLRGPLRSQQETFLWSRDSLRSQAEHQPHTKQQEGICLLTKLFCGEKYLPRVNTWQINTLGPLSFYGSDTQGNPVCLWVRGKPRIHSLQSSFIYTSRFRAVFSLPAPIRVLPDSQWSHYGSLDQTGSPQLHSERSLESREAEGNHTKLNSKFLHSKRGVLKTTPPPIIHTHTYRGRFIKARGSGSAPTWEGLGRPHRPKGCLQELAVSGPEDWLRCAWGRATQNVVPGPAAAASPRIC